MVNAENMRSIERYQSIFEKDPKSKVFAPLAEAYRRMGLLDEAIDLARTGVKNHPGFASGRVALGKCYAQKGEIEKAVEELRTAVQLAPENLLAHQILTDCYQKLGLYSDALASCKMVLFLNPNDVKIQERVRKLEDIIFGSEGPFIEDEFSMGKLKDIVGLTRHVIAEPPPPKPDLKLEQKLALLETLLDRGEFEKVNSELIEIEKTHREHPEVFVLRNRLSRNEKSPYNLTRAKKPKGMDRSQKIKKLNQWLELIEANARSV